MFVPLHVYIIYTQTQTLRTQPAATIKQYPIKARTFSKKLNYSKRLTELRYHQEHHQKHHYSLLQNSKLVYLSNSLLVMKDLDKPFTSIL